MKFPVPQLKAPSLALLLLVGCSRAPSPPAIPPVSPDRPLVSLIATSRQAVLASPHSAEPWGRLGQAFHAAQFLAEARDCYQQALRLEPRSPRWPHLLGLLQLQDEPEAAFAHLQRAAELAGPAESASRLRLAQALVERGRPDEAAQHLATLLATHASQPAAQLELSRVHLARKDLTLAEAALQPCLTNRYTARPALLLLAQIRQRQGDPREAAQLSARAAALPRPDDWPDPFLSVVHDLRVDRAKLQDEANAFLRQQRLLEAQAIVTELLRLFPDDPEGFLLQGRLHYLRRECAEAAALFRRHLQLQPDTLNGHIQLGLAQLCQQQWTAAAGTLRRAVALKPDFAPAHYNLGFALSRAGEAAAAIASFREALRCSPGDVNTLLALAEELHRAGQREEALAQLQRAVELEPANPRTARLRTRLQDGR